MEKTNQMNKEQQTMDDLFEKHFVKNDVIINSPSLLDKLKAAMQEWSSLQNQSLIDRVKELEAKVEFYREATDKVREYVFANKEIGLPCQPLFDAITDHIESKQQRISELEKERDELNQQYLEQVNKTVEWQSKCAGYFSIIESLKKENERLKKYEPKDRDPYYGARNNCDSDYDQ